MRKYVKIVLVFLAVLFFRLIPIRPPNVEPILGTVMPLSKRFGLVSSVLFSVLSIVIYDSVTAGIGPYTWSAALAYALVSIFAYNYLKNREGSALNFVKTSVFGILFYDTLTGLILGPIGANQSFYVALMGQIPFTALHLMGGILFAMTLSPMLFRLFATEKKTVSSKLVSVRY